MSIGFTSVFLWCVPFGGVLLGLHRAPSASHVEPFRHSAYAMPSANPSLDAEINMSHNGVGIPADVCLIVPLPVALSFKPIL